METTFSVQYKDDLRLQDTKIPSIVGIMNVLDNKTPPYTFTVALFQKVNLPTKLTNLNQSVVFYFAAPDPWRSNWDVYNWTMSMCYAYGNVTPRMKLFQTVIPTPVPPVTVPWSTPLIIKNTGYGNIFMKINFIRKGYFKICK